MSEREGGSTLIGTLSQILPFFLETPPLTLNVKKTKFMMFTDKNLDIGTNTLKIGNQIIEQIGSNCKDKYFKFVGHVLDDKLGWDGHIEHISKKLAGANFAINCSK